jgi:hypothetical protein
MVAWFDFDVDQCLVSIREVIPEFGAIVRGDDLPIDIRLQAASSPAMPIRKGAGKLRPLPLFQLKTDYMPEPGP